jgi:tetratricopeptide (TPR) repeat protein
MYARAIGVHRIGSPRSVAEARHLLTRLLWEYPEHLLANRALYQLARWALDEGNTDHAFSLLNTLRENSKSPILKGEAAFLEARTASLNGDSKLAVQLFEEAAASLAEPQARTARLQAAIARLRGGDFKGITLIQQTGAPSDKTLNADIELERALATTPPPAARTAIEQFLIRFPDHPRAGEARIAAIEAALVGTDPDLDFAREQLKSVSPEAGVTAQRIALAKLRIEDLSGDPAVTATAQSIIDTYPNDPAAAEASLTLGRTLFQAGNYHSARMTLETLAASDTDPARAQVASLLAARAASRGGTPQSDEEALKLFDKTIAFKGPLTAVATLERASHLIDMARLPEASDFLRKWTKTLPENDPLQLPAGLLLGKALYAQGSSSPGSLMEALAVYDKLLAHAKNQPALFNRLQYLRGMTLEQLPDEKNPSRKRDTQAFEAYHSVLETTTPPAEWEYFELCGFKALALLEKAKRWQAAIAIAQKIASFKGPHAKDAADHAARIQLEQMIW